MTEQILNIDLVQSQIHIARGASLLDLGIGIDNDALEAQGVAIQCRVTTEMPWMGK